VPGRQPGAGEQGHHPLEVARSVRSLGNVASVPVDLAGAGLPALGVGGERHAAHAVRGKVAILDALTQGVLEHRVAEVVVAVHPVMTRSRGQPELDGAAEVVEHRAPRRVLLGTAAVALVDDDEVEEVRPEVGEQRGVGRTPGERLVAGEVDLAAGVGAASHPVEHTGAEGRGEVLEHRLAQQLVSIGKVEDAVVAVGADRGLVGAQLCHHLHGGERLARTGRHQQQHAPLPARDRGEDPIDRHHLVVARCQHVAGDGGAAAVEAFGDERRAAVVQFVERQVLRPRNGGGGEGLDVALGSGPHVVLDDLPAVAGVGKGHVELLGVPQCLLQSVGGRAVLALGLHDGRRGTRGRLEDVVDEARPEVAGDAFQGDEPLGLNRVLLHHVGLGPARGTQQGHDDVAAGVPLTGTSCVGDHEPNLYARSDGPNRFSPEGRSRRRAVDEFRPPAGLP